MATSSLLCTSLLLLFFVLPGRVVEAEEGSEIRWPRSPRSRERRRPRKPRSWKLRLRWSRQRAPPRKGRRRRSPRPSPSSRMSRGLQEQMVHMRETRSSRGSRPKRECRLSRRGRRTRRPKQRTGNHCVPPLSVSNHEMRLHSPHGPPGGSPASLPGRTARSRRWRPSSRRSTSSWR